MRTLESPSRRKSFLFALEVIELHRKLKNQKEFILANQVFRSGTSIGANIEEAHGGISTADFSNKISIAYKEALETKYWLKLIFATKLLKPEYVLQLLKDCDEICRICFSILKKTRIKQNP